MTASELVGTIGELLSGKVQGKVEFRGETTLLIRREDVHEVAKFCRDELSFD